MGDVNDLTFNFSGRSTDVSLMALVLKTAFLCALLNVVTGVPAAFAICPPEVSVECGKNLCTGRMGSDGNGKRIPYYTCVCQGDLVSPGNPKCFSDQVNLERKKAKEEADRLAREAAALEKAKQVPVHVCEDCGVSEKTKVTQIIDPLPEAPENVVIQEDSASPIKADPKVDASKAQAKKASDSKKKKSLPSGGGQEGSSGRGRDASAGDPPSGNIGCTPLFRWNGEKTAAPPKSAPKQPSKYESKCVLGK